MKLFRGAISLMLGGIGLLSSPAWAVPIAVTNFSFEVPVGIPNGTPCPIPGWTCSVNSNQSVMGVFVVVPSQYTANANGLTGGLIVPNGTQAGYINPSSATAAVGGIFSQDTAAIIADNTTYRLDVFVGHRNDTGLPPPGGTIGLTHNGTAIPTATATIIDPGFGQWLNETVSYTTTSGAGNPFAGQTLGIALFQGGTVGGQINFDNVRLDQTGAVSNGNVIPEPSTWLLLGSGLAGLVIWRKHQNVTIR